MRDLFLWIISLRCETLTLIFKALPFFASDSFYILFIAFGFWRQHHHRLFWELGFLVPFSTLLNCTLKNLFSIARPDTGFHLVSVQDPFGFPSGDVQVAVVFWGMLCLVSRSLWLSVLASCLIIMMAISRLYLGVHSPYDVIAGFLFGVLTLWIYRSHFSQLFISKWFFGKTKSYWGFVFVCMLGYTLLSLQTPTPPMVIMALGALIGYGLSLQWQKQWVELQSNAAINERPHVLIILLSLGILIGITLIFPVMKDGSKFLMWGTGLLKYAFLVILIYTLFPRLQKGICAWLDPSIPKGKIK